MLKGDCMMNRAVVYAAILIVLSFFAVTAFGADPGAFKNYSADMETTSAQGSFTSRIFFKDGKMRMEGTQGSKSINIIRPDKKVIWMLMLASKTYMEIPLDMSKEDIQSKLRDPNIKTDKEFVANEVVDKHPAKKYHLTITTNGKKEKSGYIWEATDLSNFVVKYQSEDKKITTTWKNIKTGSVADSVFELPAGYKKMDMPAMPGIGGGPIKQKR
jgi:outer membrane lipoprotein-sorting protein